MDDSTYLEGNSDSATEVRSLCEGDGGEELRTEEATVPCEFLCGIAGSGKTYSVRQQCEADPTWGLLCATTGIAAINLNTITVNAALGYFDTDSLRDIYLQGRLAMILRHLRREHCRLVIDEVSMMDGDQLSMIVRAALEANTFRMDAPPLGITVVGDFAQLPPVRARWAFESDEWWRFDASTTRLTKVWRQGAGPFLDALNLTRSGHGAEAAALLTREGLKWESALSLDFDGTTIVSKNDQVGRYNQMALDRLPGATFTLTSRRWGKQRGEWKHIPPAAQFKVGAYVMLLANRYDEEGEMEYANGDCGHIVGHDPDTIYVKLVRGDKEVEVSRLLRSVSRKDKPDGWDGPSTEGEWLAREHWNRPGRRFVEGQVEYWPLRLAYASTIHKSQGLTLDRIQFDIRDHFVGQPAMLYVGVSRCRSLEGLRIVGQAERYARQCKVDGRVARWL